MGYLDIICIVLAILKIFNLISLPWVQVLIPLWVMIIIGIIKAIIVTYYKKKGRTWL